MASEGMRSPPAVEPPKHELTLAEKKETRAIVDKFMREHAPVLERLSDE